MTKEVKKEIEERVSEVNIPISVYMKFKVRYVAFHGMNRWL